MTEKDLDTIFNAAEHIYDTAWSRWYCSNTMLSFEEWLSGTSHERHYNNLQDIINSHKEK